MSYIAACGIGACGGDSVGHRAAANAGGSVATSSAGSATSTSGTSGSSSATSDAGASPTVGGGQGEGTAAVGSSTQAGGPQTGAGSGGIIGSGGAPGEVDDAEVVPSPGCARAEPNGPQSDRTVRYVLPAAYDGKTPLPLVFFLHATNIMNDFNRLTSDPRSAQYVLAGPQAVDAMSLGTFESGRPNIEALLTKVLSQVCADQNHIFVGGNGSGGRVVMSWVAQHQKLAAPATLRAAAMVGTFYGNSAPLLPVLFVHSTQSNNSRALAQDEDGTKAAKKLATFNGCSESSTPVEAASCSVNQMPIDPGCVDYKDCAQPFRFCHHDDLSNQSSGDPWPCIASSAIFDFFEAQREARGPAQ
ncbi:MAG TPA: hypothetical protein VHP33_34630 [Polyangiaceae bacterium]|nr:hypothetical protein [Polyangiaceae bacterium]